MRRLFGFASLALASALVPAIEQWAENGKAPDQIPASRVVDGQVGRTRPLYPYPQVAVYMYI